MGYLSTNTDNRPYYDIRTVVLSMGRDLDDFFELKFEGDAVAIYGPMYGP